MSKGVFELMKEKPFIKGDAIINAMDVLDSIMPKCNHQYRKTEPSLLNEEGVLLWRCVLCNKTVAST